MAQERREAIVPIVFDDKLLDTLSISGLPAAGTPAGE